MILGVLQSDWGIPSHYSHLERQGLGTIIEVIPSRIYFGIDLT